jgi:hypothetical protein
LTPKRDAALRVEFSHVASGALSNVFTPCDEHRGKIGARFHSDLLTRDSFKPCDKCFVCSLPATGESIESEGAFVADPPPRGRVLKTRQRSAEINAPVGRAASKAWPFAPTRKPQSLLHNRLPQNRMPAAPGNAMIPSSNAEPERVGIESPRSLEAPRST